MKDNQTYIEQAVIAADELAAGGKLNTQQANQFIDYVMEETALSKNARVEKFDAESLQLDKLGVGQRVAVPAAEGADPGIRRNITTGKVILTPKEIMVPVEITDKFGRLNIEGATVKDKIMRFFAIQLANNLEEFYIRGDTVGEAALEGDIYPDGSATLYSKDSFLALSDGWTRLADAGNISDMAGANIGLQTFFKTLRSLPNKYRRNKANLRWFMSPDLAELYLEKLSTRATALGDAAAGGGVHKPLGIEIVQVPLMDLCPRIVQHVNLVGTTAVALRHKPITNVVVTKSTLARSPEAAYIDTTDYVMDLTAGEIASAGGGTAIADPEVVKVTYDAKPQLILTHWQNFIIGMGIQGITIEKDRNIFKRTNEYAITLQATVNIEEATAIAKATNIGASA